MNIFRFAGDFSHLIAILILIVKIWKTRSCAGLSGKSQLLFAFVFTSRYLDLFHFISSYNTIMKIFFLVSSYGTVYLMFFKFRATYDRSHDTFRIEFLVIPATILAFLINHQFSFMEGCREGALGQRTNNFWRIIRNILSLNRMKLRYIRYQLKPRNTMITSNKTIVIKIIIICNERYASDIPFDNGESDFVAVCSQMIAWSFSIYLEAVAIMPQLFMLSRTGSAETITAHYLFALGTYRALYILNWIYRYYTEEFFDPIATVAGVVQTVLYVDFFYLYVTRVIRGYKNLELPA
ncbi:unnamed protein product [Brugia pahangi]|uniref:ER lumen protein-retaining receptor n=1 Tax=Brugia pahangi TaxID=6280 RepID=A0A0N4TN74_BRUPA|nr:unnamed protein product [Brugia pahangi]